MTNRQIVEAQRILKRLEGTPVRIDKEHGETFWQVTYDDDTYNKLLSLVEAVAKTPMKEVNYDMSPDGNPIISSTPYHREKI